MNAHLVDGTYELFRAWFGAPAAQHAGREVGATRSLVRSFAMLIARGTFTHAGVAFDQVIESFRNQLFPGYKTGEGIAEGLVSQFELAERATAALGLCVWPMVEFEADDAIATAAHHLDGDPRVDQIVITAVDKDMCQCVRGTRIVCWDRFKDVTLDEAGVIAKHGVRPESIPDYLALVGDTADGIPGIDGFGKSSAGKLLSVYRHVDAIPDAATQWTVPLRGAEKLAAALRAGRADVKLYRVLATLRTDCPIPCDLESLRWRGPDEAALVAICAELGVSRDSIRLPTPSA